MKTGKLEDGSLVKEVQSIRILSLGADAWIRTGQQLAFGWIVLSLLAFGGGLNTTVVAQTVAAPAAVPFLQQEVIATEPSSSHVWIPGAWERTGNEWVWSPGRWLIPPNPSSHWVTGYWELAGGVYQWQPGHWAHAKQGLIVEQPVVVPQLVPEVVPAIPATGGTWVPGRWEWRGGRWVWYAGYYAQPPHAQAQWIAGHWAKGQLGFWRWMPGHWRT
jgi:hypothetical protein